MGKKKLYLDRTVSDVCSAIFIKDAEIVTAGTTVHAMSVKDKNDEYKKYKEEYDIHFIFDDDIPKIDFYTVPQVDIMALNSDDGYIGTIGQMCDLESNAPICYIDKNKKCYLIAQNGAEFLKIVSEWKKHLKPYDGITFYNSKAEAENVLEFIDTSEFEKDLQAVIENLKRK